VRAIRLPRRCRQDTADQVISTEQVRNKLLPAASERYRHPKRQRLTAPQGTADAGYCSRAGTTAAREMIMGNVRSLQEGQITTWNDHNEASWVDLFSPEATFSGPGGVRGSGTEMARTFYHIWQDAFPDSQLKTLQIVDGEDTVVLEGVFEGTHTEALNAPGGPILATGKRVAVPLVSVLGVAGDRFTSFAVYFDQMELLTQLGLAPAPTMTPS
jgi:predicted ester cyclase